MLKYSLCFLCLVLIAVVFWPYDPDFSVNQKLEEVLDSHYMERVGLADPILLDLKDVTDFDWDTVHVLGDYASCLDVLAAVGLWAHACHMMTHDNYKILVFEFEGRRVSYSQINVLQVHEIDGVMSFSVDEARLEAIQIVALESQFRPKELEGLYVNWLMPAGSSSQPCMYCVGADRQYSDCSGPAFKNASTYCDSERDYQLPVVTPSMRKEFSPFQWRKQQVSGQQ